MKKSFFFKAQIIIISCTVFLAVFGCVMVYSASRVFGEQNYGNPTFFLTKQIIGVVLGLACMIGISFFPYEKLKKLKWPLYIISIILLVLVFVPGIGKENYGAKRWIGIGSFTMQPSEIAKFSMVLFMAAHFSTPSKHEGKFVNILLPLGVGLSYCALIILEPNMSITMCVGIVMVLMLFLGGVKWKHMLMIGAPAAAAVPIMIFAEPYRIRRLMAFLDPWASPKDEGFQLIQSLYAIGSGGLFGVGLFASRQKYLFLPFAESDFIFSIIVEELGLFGGLIVIGVFALLIITLIRVAMRSKDKFACLLVFGVAAVIGVQVLINISVVTGLIPPTGLPLPFISAGSTSLIVFMSAIGICLNVAKKSSKIYNSSETESVNVFKFSLFKKKKQ